MSGISGGFFGEGTISHPTNDEGVSCLKLVIITNLASVDEDMLKKTSVGEILQVEAQSIDGPVVVMKGDMVLGTVLSSHLVQLLNCMNEGTRYQAEVIRIEAAICQVKISAIK